MIPFLIDYSAKIIFYCFFWFLFLFVSPYQLSTGFISKNKVCVEWLESLACLLIMSPFTFTKLLPAQTLGFSCTSVIDHKLSMTFGRVATQLTPSQGHPWSSFFQCWFQHLLGGLLGSFLVVFSLIRGCNSTFCLANHLCNSPWITSLQQLVSVHLVPSNKTTSHNIGSRTWLLTPLTPRYYHGHSKPSFWMYLT